MDPVKDIEKVLAELQALSEARQRVIDQAKQNGTWSLP